MRSASYQRSHHEFPCIFCGSDDETVVGHHIAVKGLGGMGTKVSDALVIPVCHEHHAKCHGGYYSQERQTERLLAYWHDRFVAKYGFAQGLDKMGDALWEGLQ